jgi:hypothetical protein
VGWVGLGLLFISLLITATAHDENALGDVVRARNAPGGPVDDRAADLAMS